MNDNERRELAFALIVLFTINVMLFLILQHFLI